MFIFFTPVTKLNAFYKIIHTHTDCITEIDILDELMNIVVIGGGTATNNVITGFMNPLICKQVSFIMPVSDNGGSSSEIIRIFGGFAIGDIRSRIVALIPDKNNKMKQFFSYRLNRDNIEAKNEWTNILNGKHEIWSLIDDIDKFAKMSEIFHFFERQRIKIKDEKELVFRFELSSVGNIFLLGCKYYFKDKYNNELNKNNGIKSKSIINECIEFMMRNICEIDTRFNVLPILSDFDKTYNICAKLENGDIIKGQNEISHPVEADKVHIYRLQDFKDEMEQPLKSKITDISYIDERGKEINICEIVKDINPQVIQAVSECDVIVYSIGSFFTSILAVGIVLKYTIPEKEQGKKLKIVYLVNGDKDRESSGQTLDDQIEIIKRISHEPRDVRVVRGHTRIDSSMIEETLLECVQAE